MPRTKKITIKESVQDKKVEKPKVKVVAKTARKTQKADNGLTVNVYDMKGKVVEEITLPKEIFGAKINPALMSQAVRVYLANQRRGTVSTKTRGEVQGSSRKIYRQKGTGRARHGSLRAPIFVHGGVVFGPKPRDFSLKLPQKMKKAALFSALSVKVKDGSVKVVAGLEKIAPKTKEMVSVINHVVNNPKSFEVHKKIALILPKDIEHVKRAARNIEGVTLAKAQMLTTYEVLNNNVLLFMKESVEAVEKMFAKEK